MYNLLLSGSRKMEDLSFTSGSPTCRFSGEKLAQWFLWNWYQLPNSSKRPTDSKHSKLSAQVESTKAYARYAISSGLKDFFFKIIVVLVHYKESQEPC